MSEITKDPSYTSKYWGDKDFAEDAAPDIVAWRLARSAIEHENSLVNHRMTWFLTSQAFLFSAFVLVFIAQSKGDLKDLEPLPALILGAIGFFGGYFALATQDGLSRAFIATSRVTNSYRKLAHNNTFDPIVPPLHLWEPPKFFSQQKLPIAALALWIVLVLGCIIFPFPEIREQIKSITVESVLKILSYLLFAAIGYALRGSRFFRHPKPIEDTYRELPAKKE